MAVGPTRRRREEPDLLGAAREVLTEGGPHGLTIRSIAERAGCSTMPIYRRFGSKLGVIDALYREGFDRVLREFESVEATDDPLFDLAALCHVYRATVLGNRAHYLVMFGRAVPDFEPGEESRRRAGLVISEIAAVCERASERGALRRQSPESLARLVFGLCHGLVSLELEGLGGDQCEDHYELAVASMLRGLAPER
ncbi:MAG: TetR/AcrR family transcriptional regulator [Actinomycetota bacterium]|nr:TetR/AcrR family transcriptional regulator [Actinomycetota bacterium]